MAKRILEEVESAGGVVINDDGEVLFCHPTRSRWNNWRMPKGLVDPDEDHKKAALREVLEETGYSCKAIVKLKTPTRYKSAMAGKSIWKTLYMYLMRPVEQIQKPDWENDAFRWVPFDKVESYAAKVELPFILEAIEEYNRRKNAKKRKT